MTDERRLHPRIPLISIARLSRQGIEAKSSVLVRDISTHGLGIYSREAFNKEELVLVELSLPTDEGTLEESILGEVAWIAPLSDGIHHAVGIRFDAMEKEKPKLYAQIKRLEAQNPVTPDAGGPPPPSLRRS